METKRLKLSDVRIDGGTQLRCQMYPDWVSTIVENMKNDANYPALSAVYDGENYWLWDGFHRYYALKQLGVKEFEVDFTLGTLDDARELALEANDKHGKPPTREDKIYRVQECRKWEKYKDATFNAIAKACNVSASFVGAILDPKIAEKQKENKDRSDAKRLAQKAENLSSTKQDEQEAPAAPSEGMAPSEEEMAATEAALAADVEAMQKLLEADDKLAEAYKVIEAQNLRIAQQDLRMKGLMNEKNEAIRMVKDLQKQLDKIKGQ